ncbi:MAG: DUF169 domain-containing protein [Nitrososphaerota archaeon]|nr:DUF169 domain-containing protein [Nitrososphaerota archaeon]
MAAEDFSEKMKALGETIERLAFLRTHPIAIKILKDEEEIPPDSIRPKRDRGEHLALCQAFAMARRQGLSITMLKEDHWCFEPLISYGLVEPQESYLKGLTSYPFFISNQEAAIKRVKEAMRLPFGRYVGLTCAPLKKVSFDPDIVMIYCNTAQLRYLLLALRYRDGYQVASKFDPIGSCVHSVIPPFLTGECCITVPDPGDYERAIAGEDEMILSIPRRKLEDLMFGLQHFENLKIYYKSFTYVMRPDFPQPPFYREYFKMWGIDEPKK